MTRELPAGLKIVDKPPPTELLQTRKNYQRPIVPRDGVTAEAETSGFEPMEWIEYRNHL